MQCACAGRQAIQPKIVAIGNLSATRPLAGRFAAGAAKDLKTVSAKPNTNAAVAAEFSKSYAIGGPGQAAGACVAGGAFIVGGVWQKS
jgi:hypothetical protein